jgi:magnesium-transporting ATPase (P-type)
MVFTSYAAYFAYLAVTDDWVDFTEQHFTFKLLFGSPLFYLTVFFVVSLCFLLDFAQVTLNQIVLKDP